MKDLLRRYPDLHHILLDSKLLDILPGGVSIATDVTCRTIVHNPTAAGILRIEPWGEFSHSSEDPPPVDVYQGGKLLTAAEMPIQKAAWEGKDVVGFELELVWKDGISKVTKWSASPLRDENGNIRGAMATMEDITDVAHMSRELKSYKMYLEELVRERTYALVSSEERFRKVFYSSPHPMAINRKADMGFIEVNTHWLTMMELNREEVIGKTPLELGFPESECAELMRLFEHNGSVSNMEFSLVKRYNIEGTLIISAERIVINSEECILLATNDITELKRIQAEMVRLDCLNLIGQMAAGIGHEIRNPMTTVRGYLQLLGNKPELLAHSATFKTMIEELDRANSIITEFLSLARDRPTELKLQNINEILSSLYPLIEADTFTQNKQVVFIPGETPEILINSKEISQLILNLCRNGLEAMPSRGMLTIRTYCKDKNVILSVQDEGCGIPKEYLDKLGTPFFTTKENGTGLGLAICYSIVNRHSGRIIVESNTNGTTFSVLFPCQANGEASLEIMKNAQV
jgi:PAS domain S-box